MRRWVSVCFFSIVFWLSIGFVADGKTYNPLKYGLREANNAEERYWILYRTHEEALRNNGSVNYAGIDTIEIDIPKGARPRLLS